jgi:hypothetical protein
MPLDWPTISNGARLSGSSSLDVSIDNIVSQANPRARSLCQIPCLYTSCVATAIFSATPAKAGSLSLLKVSWRVLYSSTRRYHAKRIRRVICACCSLTYGESGPRAAELSASARVDNSATISFLRLTCERKCGMKGGTHRIPIAHIGKLLHIRVWTLSGRSRGVGPAYT